MQQLTNSHVNVSEAMPPLSRVVDWGHAQEEQHRKLWATILMFSHLFLIVGLLCWFCWIRSLRLSGCLTHRDAEALIERASNVGGMVFTSVSAPAPPVPMPPTINIHDMAKNANGNRPPIGRVRQ